MDNPTPAQRSTFVTGVAWIFIVLGAFAALVCLMQIIMVAVAFPQGVMPRIASPGDALVHQFARLVFDHIQSIFVALLLVFVMTVAVSVGLLKRENWARIAFVGLMALGVVWNVASIVLVYYFLPSMSEVINDEPAALQAQFNVMRNVAAVLGFAMFSGFIGLFGWILGRFVSEEIRSEFA